MRQARRKERESMGNFRRLFRLVREEIVPAAEEGIKVYLVAFLRVGVASIVHPGGLDGDPAVSLGHKHAIESLRGHRGRPAVPI